MRKIALVLGVALVMAGVVWSAANPKNDHVLCWVNSGDGDTDGDGDGGSLTWNDGYTLVAMTDAEVDAIGLNSELWQGWKGKPFNRMKTSLHSANVAPVVYSLYNPTSDRSVLQICQALQDGSFLWLEFDDMGSNLAGDDIPSTIPTSAVLYAWTTATADSQAHALQDFGTVDYGQTK